MTIYYLYFSVLGLLALIETNFRNSLILIIGIFILFFLILTVGFKSDTFGDYCSYALQFFDSVSLPYYLTVYKEYLFHYERGFELLLVMLPKTIIDHPIFIFLFIAFFSLSVQFYGIKKMSPYFFLSILIYFSHNFILKELAQVRSGVAASFVLLSIYFLAKNKNFKFYFFVIFSSFFHLTGLIAFIGYVFDIIIKKFNDPRNFYYLILLVTMVTGFFNLSDLIFSFIVENRFAPQRFFVYFSDCPEAWNDAYGYIGCGRQTINSEGLGIFSNPTSVKYLLISLFSIVFYKKLINSSTYFRPIFNFYFMGTCWIIFFNDFGILASRVASILTVGEVILIPILASIIKPTILAKIAIIIIFIPIFYINVNRLFEYSKIHELPFNAFYTGEYCPDYGENDHRLINKKIMNN